MVATKTQYQAAIDRARERGGARAAHHQGGCRFAVQSANGSGVYTLLVHPSGDTRCSCPAGQVQRPCWHAAAVWLWSLGRGGLPFLRQLIQSGRLPAQRLGPLHVVHERDLALVQRRRPGRPPRQASR